MKKELKNNCISDKIIRNIRKLAERILDLQI